MLHVDFALGSAPVPIVNLLRTPQVKRTRQGEEVGSGYVQALIEVHERICGPNGGLIEPMGEKPVLDGLL